MGETVAWMFYDGTCGVCHAGVAFAIKRDSAGRVHFAPLGGQIHGAVLKAGDPSRSIDSVVVVRPDGTVFTRSAAMVELLRSLDRPWPTVARVLHRIPVPIRDFGYDFVALNRRRLRRKPVDVCPVVAQDLRNRFSP